MVKGAEQGRAFKRSLALRRLIVKSLFEAGVRAFYARPCSAKAYRKIPVQSLSLPVLKTKNNSAKIFRFARRRRRRSLRYLDAENAESEERPQYPQNVLFLGAPVLFSRLRPLFQRTSAAKPPYRGEPDPEPHPLRRCFPSAGAVPARR